VSISAADQRIRGLRSPKTQIDPYRPHGYVIEEERRPGGKLEQALTIFLAGAECPFTCSFCDLWRWTIDGPTPPGALTTQVKAVLKKFDGATPHRLKLYNASNFFDQRAVPPTDLASIAELSAGFDAVTVESHANTIGPRTVEFARVISGRLEVAVGLETVHPAAAKQINKRLDLNRFDSAARLLSENGIDLRVFVLLGTPHIPVEESVEWTVRTAQYAAERGASVVSIIPVRGGNGEMERLGAIGQFTPPTLAQLEEAIDRCLKFTDCVVTADLWDVDRLRACEQCRSVRIERLRRANVTGRPQPMAPCAMCVTA
jgi:radical SAM enzyme (TIGR01210 family)